MFRADGNAKKRVIPVIFGNSNRFSFGRICFFLFLFFCNYFIYVFILLNLFFTFLILLNKSFPTHLLRFESLASSLFFSLRKKTAILSCVSLSLFFLPFLSFFLSFLVFSLYTFELRNFLTAIVLSLC